MKDLESAWKAINAYAKIISQLAACKVAGYEIDDAEHAELEAAKMAVKKELIALQKGAVK